jgi:oxygen-independent coproporphyrinogen-3 oxidase
MPLSHKDAMAEYLFLGLRMSEGVMFKTFEQEFGGGLKDVFGQELTAFLAQGLLAEDPHRIRLTRRGMLLSNQVFQQFLP